MWKVHLEVQTFNVINGQSLDLFYTIVDENKGVVLEHAESWLDSLREAGHVILHLTRTIVNMGNGEYKDNC